MVRHTEELLKWKVLKEKIRTKQDVDESYEVKIPVAVWQTLSVSGFGGSGVCLSCRGNRRGDGLSVSHLVTAPAAILLLVQPTVPLVESRSRVM